mmetsp:Transcript_26106/g.68525  ORF Transcript_26106/g.68525 Transcript_26106/m.68525 type:complete len:261 (+) Transcript_26106:325-1107(+)
MRAGDLPREPVGCAGDRTSVRQRIIPHSVRSCLLCRCRVHHVAMEPAPLAVGNRHRPLHPGRRLRPVLDRRGPGRAAVGAVVGWQHGWPAAAAAVCRHHKRVGPQPARRKHRGALRQRRSRCPGNGVRLGVFGVGGTGGWPAVPRAGSVCPCRPQPCGAGSHRPDHASGRPWRWWHRLSEAVARGVKPPLSAMAVPAPLQNKPRRLCVQWCRWAVASCHGEQHCYNHTLDAHHSSLGFGEGMFHRNGNHVDARLGSRRLL